MNSFSTLTDLVFTPARGELRITCLARLPLPTNQSSDHPSPALRAPSPLLGGGQGAGVKGVRLSSGTQFAGLGITWLLSLIAVLLLTGCQTAPPDPGVTLLTVCRWTDTPPVLDGKLDDAVWKRAFVIDQFPSYWNHTDPGLLTTAWLLWDNDALYFAARMTDRELRSFGEKHNDKIYNGDVFELFFKPSPNAPRYYEFEVNPKGVLMELNIPKAPFDFSKLAAEPPLGAQVVIALDGTLNQPGDVDRGWIIEGRIPWSAFADAGGRPAPDAVWRFALCRYDYGPEGTKPLLTSSAPLRKLSYHRTEDYGWLRFEGPVK